MVIVHAQCTVNYKIGLLSGPQSSTPFGLRLQRRVRSVAPAVSLAISAVSSAVSTAVSTTPLDLLHFPSTGSCGSLRSPSHEPITCSSYVAGEFLLLSVCRCNAVEAPESCWNVDHSVDYSVVSSL